MPREPTAKPGKQGLSNLRLSYYLSLWLFGGFVLVAVVVAATSYLMASEQNRVAADKTRELIATGIKGIEEKLEILVLDYSYWNAMYEAVQARDIDWLYENSGTSATSDGYMDLNIVVEPGGRANFGWIHGGDAAPEADLIEAGILADLAGRLDRTPVEGRHAVRAYAASGGDLWLLATTRIIPLDGRALPGDANLARHVFGVRVTNEVIAGLGDQFLVDGVALSSDPVPGKDDLALRSPSGTPLAYVTWEAPRPGTATLKRIAGPLIAVMALLALATTMAGRMMVGSARRLERALVLARAADQAKTDFLANISHELRTPMNGVIGVVNILTTTQLDDKQKHMLQIVLKSAQTQMNIIQDLVEFSRIESGTATLDLAPFRPVDELRNVVDLLRPDAERKGIELVLKVKTDGLEETLGDAQAFRQVATNIVGNAIKFTDSGRVSVGLEAVTRRDEAALTFSVSDTGPGIAPEHQTMIFERFNQVDSKKTRGKGGSGLGLAISKALTEMMGGTIEVNSALGRGATFTMRVALEIPRPAMHAAA